MYSDLERYFEKRRLNRLNWQDRCDKQERHRQSVLPEYVLSWNELASRIRWKTLAHNRHSRRALMLRIPHPDRMELYWEGSLNILLALELDRENLEIRYASPLPDPSLCMRHNGMISPTYGVGALLCDASGMLRRMNLGEAAAYLLEPLLADAA